MIGMSAKWEIIGGNSGWVHPRLPSFLHSSQVLSVHMYMDMLEKVR